MSVEFCFAIAKVRIIRGCPSWSFSHSYAVTVAPFHGCRPAAVFFLRARTEFRSLCRSMVVSRGKCAKFTSLATVEPPHGPKITMQFFRLVTVGTDTRLQVKDGANAISPCFSSCPSFVVSCAMGTTHIVSEAPLREFRGARVPCALWRRAARKRWHACGVNIAVVKVFFLIYCVCFAYQRLLCIYFCVLVVHMRLMRRLIVLSFAATASSCSLLTTARRTSAARTPKRLVASSVFFALPPTSSCARM